VSVQPKNESAAMLTPAISLLEQNHDARMGFPCASCLFLKALLRRKI